MGTIIHRAVVVTGFQADHVRVCHEVVSALRRKSAYSGDKDYALLVTPVQIGVNGYASFAILPDGSKFGWPPHTAACEMRREAREICSGLDFVEVVYGETGQDGEPWIDTGAK